MFGPNSVGRSNLPRRGAAIRKGVNRLNARNCTGFVINGRDVNESATPSPGTFSRDVFLLPGTAAVNDPKALPFKIGCNFGVLRACCWTS
jgi:hypothetical protein